MARRFQSSPHLIPSDAAQNLRASIAVVGDGIEQDDGSIFALVPGLVIVRPGRNTPRSIPPSTSFLQTNGRRCSGYLFAGFSPCETEFTVSDWQVAVIDAPPERASLWSGSGGW